MSACQTSIKRTWQWLALGNSLILFTLLISVPHHAFCNLIVTGIGLGQLVVLGIWLALGNSRLSTRFVGFAVLGVALVSLAFRVKVGWSLVGVSLIFLLGDFIVVSWPLYVLWARGWHLKLAPADDSPPEKWRLSIAQLLISMLLVAFIASIHTNLTLMATNAQSGSFRPDHWSQAIIGSLLLLALLAGFEAALLAIVFAC